MAHRCVLNTVVVWLHILVVPFWCAMLHCSEVDSCENVFVYMYIDVGWLAD